MASSGNAARFNQRYFNQARFVTEEEPQRRPTKMTNVRIDDVLGFGDLLRGAADGNKALLMAAKNPGGWSRSGGATLRAAVAGLWVLLAGVACGQTSPAAPAPVSKLPISVGKAVGVEFFNAIARDDDLFVFVERDLESGEVARLAPQVRKGKVGWNCPSLEYAKKTCARWKGLVRVLMYDYESWQKTPSAEQADPDRACKEAMEFARAQGVGLIVGPSWRMITRRDSTLKEGVVQEDKLKAIARHTDELAVHAMGLLREFPDRYVEWVKTCGKHAKAVNPRIRLWAVVSPANQTVDQMWDTIQKLQGCVGGVSIAGGGDPRLAEQLIRRLRK